MGIAVFTMAWNMMHGMMLPLRRIILPAAHTNTKAFASSYFVFIINIIHAARYFCNSCLPRLDSRDILYKKRKRGITMSRVLIINGSPRQNGNTALALGEMEKIFRENGIEVTTVQLGGCEVRGCIACNVCKESGRCIFDDAVNQIAPVFEKADGLVVASPVYFASANATLIAFLDRLFYSTKFDKTMKVGASVVCARRGGCSATFDELNKYFAISGMPIASSQYWNSVHGRDEGESALDTEGMQTMRTLARNMSFLIKSIALGRAELGLPEKERTVKTNFIAPQGK